jgi:uncharacterized membrane protein YbhN (UPF0104 family)
VRRGVAIALALAGLAGLAVWLAWSPAALAPLTRVSGESLALLVLVSFGALVAQGVQFGVLLWLFGLRVPAIEWLGLTCVNNLLAYALPVRGGTLVRAAYLNRVRALPLQRYAALTVSSHVVMTAVVSLAGMTLALAIGGEALPPWLLAAFALGPLAVGAAAWALAALSERIARASATLGEHARAFRASLGTWRRRPDRSLAFVGVSGGVFVLHGVRLLVALRAVGLRVSWPAAFLVHAAAAASAVAAVTPGNLGTREAVVGVVAAALGLDARTAVLGTLVDRAVGILEAVAGSVLLGRGLERRMRAGAG